MSVELVLFLLIGGMAVVFAIGMLLSENAVHSALFLIGNFAAVAVLFLMLDAPFIAMVQIAVYAGAIMVLFLFVIMLLGGEKTTDTTRRFRWLSGVATALAMGFLLAVGIPLVASSFELPEYAGDEPQLRLVHGASIGEVSVSLSGPNLAEPFGITEFGFADVTEYVTFPEGGYTVTLTSADGSTNYSQDITLARGQMLTALAFGDTTQGLSVALIPNSLEPAGNDLARLVVMNGFVDAPLALVELGGNGVLDVALRNDEPAIFDDVWADGLTFGQAVAVNVEEGDYQVAFVDTSRLSTTNPSDAIVMRLREYEVKADTEQTVLFVGEPAQAEGNTIDAVNRPTLLDRDHNELTFATNPAFGSPGGIGRLLFVEYLLPVNLVGFLLLVGLVGVIVLSKPEGEKRPRLVNRRKVSRPLVNVIAQQTGADMVADTPKLDRPSSGD